MKLFCLLQLSNIFLTKENDIRLGKKKGDRLNSVTCLSLSGNQFMFLHGLTGDFGLAKLLDEEGLTSSV